MTTRNEVSTSRLTHALAVAVLLNVLVLSVFYSVATPAFDTNDDVTMMRIVSGMRTGGEPSEFLIYTNIAIGQLLKVLFERWPGINWYSCYFLVVHGAGMTAVLYALLQMRPIVSALLTYTVLFLFLEMPQLMTLHHITTGFIAFLGGVFLCGVPVGEEKTSASYGRAVAAGALMAIAGMIRPNVLGLGAVLALPYFALRLRHRYPPRVIVAGGIAAVLFVAAYAYDRDVYQRDEQWRVYRSFNKTRSSVLDSPRLPFNDDVRDVLRTIGWSENDYQMFTRWFFFDHETYSEEKIAYLNEHVSTVAGGRQILQAIRTSVSHAPLMWIFTAANLVAFVLAGGREQRKYVAVALGVGSVTGLALIIGAKMVDRVAWPILFFANVMLFMHYDPLEAVKGWLPRRRAPMLAALTVVVLGVFATPMWAICVTDRRNREDIQGLDDMIRQMDPRPGDLYVSWGSALRAENTDPLGSPNTHPSFVYLISGWTTNSPLNARLLERMQIGNVEQALLHDPRVHLIAERQDLDLLRRYIDEHYGIDMAYQVLHDFGSVVVVQIADTRADGSGRATIKTLQ